MTPAEVRACSIWEFDQAVAGWTEAHVPEDPAGGGLSAAEEDELWAWMQEKEGRC